MRRRRLALVLVGACALVGLALGLALGRGGESARAQGPPGVISRAPFRTVSWGTTGSAILERRASGELVLRFTRDFRTQRAPELYVHLGDVRLKLQHAWGGQTYVLPHGVPPNVTVQVFCEKCNKAWGQAKLRPVQRRATA